MGRDHINRKSRIALLPGRRFTAAAMKWVAARQIMAVAGLAAIVLTCLTSQPALADLRLCNKTETTVSISIGYKSKKGWTTEGWWNIPGAKCNTLIPGPLAARYYYIYAVDAKQGGEWGGKAFMCTRRKMFTILGTEDCVARGYDRTGFFEIDTQDQRSWTVQLTEPTQKGTTAK
ncbi:putative integral membrane protein [Hartmannibacter diazotrophicus]|uniref:Putative integral membrane protein n=2 Tax=Hartmannibacter diazotrophicus TaxID=1482074 RepID=A0A2C9DAS0_9HYPH|nr:putative integral membrane protein [Hartmannibacter diazotrophicus]